MASGRLRRDLFFRLNVVSLELPALRERREDIVPLAEHFLQFYQRAQARSGLSFSDRCEVAMAGQEWPGNIRELRNAVERAVILSPGQVLEAGNLGLADFTRPAGQDPRDATIRLGASVSLQDMEREHIARVVARTPSLEAAARILEIDPSTLQRKRFGLV